MRNSAPDLTKYGISICSQCSNAMPISSMPLKPAMADMGRRGRVLHLVVLTVDSRQSLLEFIFRSLTDRIRLAVSLPSRFCSISERSSSSVLMLFDGNSMK